MDARIIGVMQECTESSDQERITFPEVVTKLIAAGVERYHADLVRAEKTYYLPDGGSLVVATRAVHGQPASTFSAAGVEAAVRAVQSGKIKYIEFCEHIMAAGCVGYFVSLAGRRAVYYGRGGDNHVELFPAAT